MFHIPLTTEHISVILLKNAGIFYLKYTHHTSKQTTVNFIMLHNPHKIYCCNFNSLSTSDKLNEIFVLKVRFSYHHFEKFVKTESNPVRKYKQCFCLRNRDWITCCINEFIFSEQRSERVVEQSWFLTHSLCTPANIIWLQCSIWERTGLRVITLHSLDFHLEHVVSKRDEIIHINPFCTSAL